VPKFRKARGTHLTDHRQSLILTPITITPQANPPPTRGDRTACPQRGKSRHSLQGLTAAKPPQPHIDKRALRGKKEASVLRRETPERQQSQALPKTDHHTHNNKNCEDP
jgi:hypothetical protein